VLGKRERGNGRTTEENLRRTSSALLRHTKGKAVGIVEDVKDASCEVIERSPCLALNTNRTHTYTLQTTHRLEAAVLP
jgi:hypothetical protein